MCIITCDTKHTGWKYKTWIWGINHYNASVFYDVCGYISWKWLFHHLSVPLLSPGPVYLITFFLYFGHRSAPIVQYFKLGELVAGVRCKFHNWHLRNRLAGCQTPITCTPSTTAPAPIPPPTLLSPKIVPQHLTWIFPRYLVPIPSWVSQDFYPEISQHIMENVPRLRRKKCLRSCQAISGLSRQNVTRVKGSQQPGP